MEASSPIALLLGCLRHEAVDAVHQALLAARPSAAAASSASSSPALAASPAPPPTHPAGATSTAAAAAAESKAQLEFALRLHAEQCLAAAMDEQQAVAAAGRALDLALWAAENDLLDAVSVYVLLDDLLERTPVDECTPLIEHLLDARRSRLSAEQRFCSGRARLQLLRVSAEFMRRLSKYQHAPLAGRLLALLARLLPLADKGGVNAKGESHAVLLAAGDASLPMLPVRPAAVLVPPPSRTTVAAVTAPSAADQDPFVSRLQHYFANPHLLSISTTPAASVAEHWANASKAIEAALTALAAAGGRTGGGSGSSSGGTGGTGGAAVSQAGGSVAAAAPVPAGAAAIGSAGKAAGTGTSSAAGTNKLFAPALEELFFPKYFIQQPEILPLQLRDESVRRQLLLQMLWLLQSVQYPLNPAAATSAAAAGKTTASAPATDGGKDLAQQQHQQQLELSRRVRELLDSPPTLDGRRFGRLAQPLLHRELHWLGWKRDGCKVFDKPAVVYNPKRKQQQQQVAVADASDISEPTPKRSRLSRYWSPTLTDEYLTDPSRTRTPDLYEFLRPVEEEMEDEELEEDLRTENDKVYTWKALRLIAKQRLPLFQKMFPTQPPAKAPAAPAPTADAASVAPATVPADPAKSVESQAMVTPPGFGLRAVLNSLIEERTGKKPKKEGGKEQKDGKDEGKTEDDKERISEMVPKDEGSSASVQSQSDMPPLVPVEDSVLATAPAQSPGAPDVEAAPGPPEPIE